MVDKKSDYLIVMTLDGKLINNKFRVVYFIPEIEIDAKKYNL